MISVRKHPQIDWFEMCSVDRHRRTRKPSGKHDPPIYDWDFGYLPQTPLTIPPFLSNHDVQVSGADVYRRDLAGGDLVW